MLRALWFFFQLTIVVCAAIWIASQQGAVDIVWGKYNFSLHLGVFLLFLTLFIIVALAFFRILGAIVSLPGSFSRKHKERMRAKGFKSLTRGFVAIAAGDAKKATHYAKEVRYLLPNELGLPLLLEAQAARLRGEEHVARQSFEQLLDDKDAAFFGIRGLLKSSLDAGDAVKALEYAKSALAQNPKQPWILKSVYDLELRNHNWDEAWKILERVRRYKGMDEDLVRKDEVSLLLLLAERDRENNLESASIKKIERAVKVNPAFVPAVLVLCENYFERGKTGRIASLVERAWKVNPHPDLALMWDRIAPQDKGADSMRRLRWFEKLAAFKPESADGQLAAAKISMDAALWGQAKAYLTMAENLRPTAQVFRMRADLEDLTGHNPAVIRAWLEKAASAPPDNVWYCSLTGVIYDRWSPVAQPHGSFNTIEWGNPLIGKFSSPRPIMREWKDPLMIEAVQA